MQPPGRDSHVLRNPVLQPEGFVLLRTPLLPFETFSRWSSNLAGAASVGNDSLLEEALTCDGIRLRDGLADLFRDPLLREAIFLASPVLHSAMADWLDHDRPASDRLIASLARYLVRMTCRPTPFGLFAGCTFGHIGESTRMTLAERREYRRMTRLDCGLLFAAVREMVANIGLRKLLTYRPNDSIFRGAGRMTVVASRYNGDELSWHLVAVRENVQLLALLKRASAGARFGELVDCLCDSDAGLKLADAEAFIHELIDAQLVVPTLGFGVTGRDPLEQVFETLRRAGDGARATVLQQVKQQLTAIDEGGVGQAPDVYAALGDSVRRLCGSVGLKHLVQVDLFKPGDSVEVGADVAVEVAKAIELLARLPARRFDGLSEFRRRFLERYEQRAVPLLEVLDEEHGIGFPDGRSDARQEIADPREQGWNAFVVNEYVELRRKNAIEMVLNPETLDQFASKDWRKRLPMTLGALVTIAGSTGPVAKGAQGLVHLRAVHGPSGATYLGRFCHGDVALLHAVRRYLRMEEALDPSVVFAEIVHLPAGRLGNVTFRPLLRQFEIPYLCNSGTDLRFQLPVDDLLVVVRDGGVRLWSTRLAKEVVPRLTNAHSHFLPRNLPVYRFLCALQGQDSLAAVRWSWGPLAPCAFLPRVRVGRVLVSLACWRINAAALAADGGSKERFRNIQDLRRDLHLPRFVSLAESANELVIDLDNIILSNVLADTAKRRGNVVISELWPTPNELAVSGPEGGFVNEVVIPYKQQVGDVESASPLMLVANHQKCVRSFPPGSRWLYLRLYVGDALADELLRSTVRKLVRCLLETGGVQEWHFLRYRDSDAHIRLRVKTTRLQTRRRCRDIVDDYVSRALRAGLVQKVEYGTYEPEVERYGGPAGVRLAEHLFTVDSSAAIEILAAYAGDAGHLRREQLLIPGVDWMLADLGFDINRRLAILGGSAPGDQGTKKRWARHFREHRTLFGQLLTNKAPDPLWRVGLSILQRRGRALAGIGNAIRQLAETGDLLCDMDKMILSFAHLHANRLMRGFERRTLEHRTYDSLCLYHRGTLARERGRHAG